MNYTPRNKKTVIPDLIRDLYDFCEITKRSRHRGRELLLLILIFFFLAPAFSQSTIKIGFLIRDKKDIAIQQTAQLAIQEANARGGYNGQKFELVTRSCDGPWGMTSKQAVALIYEDQVPIIVTALDGRNAHLAEQVTAKSHVVMLSTLSSDPTLSRAYVPWYFRMVPDDRQQAEVLVHQVYELGKAESVAVASFDDYDGKTSIEAFINRSKEKGFNVPKLIAGKKREELLKEINNANFDALVLAGSSDESHFTISQIRKNKAIYAFQNLTYFINKYEPETFSGIEFSNALDANQAKWQQFQQSFQQKYLANPSPSYAYIYDGILLAVEAIKRYGPDSEIIRKNFKDLKYPGITGTIEFDKLGDRKF